jgi:hypothetical protein
MKKATNPDDALLRRWVDTWRRAGIELERIRRAELQSIDTQEAVRHLFEGFVPTPGPPTSGLVEQQVWFTRLRDRLKT